ncbi:Protein of unknown function [Bacillus cytotoxicus]|nr:Protein of unknown function [Bacillus cytotoxicus]
MGVFLFASITMTPVS